MTLVLDAMGSDTYPDPELHAAVIAAKTLNEEILLVGKQSQLEEPLKALNPKGFPVRIIDAPDLLEMTDKPVEAARKKPRNSMAVGLELVKTGQAQAFVTAGNTGGAYFNAVTTLKRMQGISRPALTATIPTRKGFKAFLDTGANADCRPEFMLEFALMGSVYAEKVLGINNPRVALLANGEEAGKGNQLIHDSYPLLEKSGLNFIGNAEPKDVLAGHADVIVADGFSGNIFIKSSEATAKLIIDLLKEGINAGISRKLGYLLIKPAFEPLKKMLDPAEIGAAMLMGVNGCVFIGHGRSDSRALVTALKVAHQAVKANILQAMQQTIEERAGLLDGSIISQ